MLPRSLFSQVALCAIATSTWPNLVCAEDAKSMVFRFRANHEDAAWTTPVDYKGDAHVVTRSTPLSDIYGLNPLNEDFAAADFDGSGDFVTTRSAVKARRDATQQAVTVQLWFKADRVSGSQVLLSNRNAGGFAVSLDGDQLVGAVRVGERYVAARAIGRIQAGKWFLVTFRAYTSGSGSQATVTLTLHLNHRLEGMELFSLASGESIVDSSIPLTLGAEAGQLTYPFNGRIHAATVRNCRRQVEMSGSGGF